MPIPVPEDATIAKTEAELKETIHSPQFKQATQAFSHALSSGQLGPVLKQFGINDAACLAAAKVQLKYVLLLTILRET